MQQLLPEGWAWRRDADAVLTKLLEGFSEEQTRLVLRVLQLLLELDPRQAASLLAKWGSVMGLPSPCFPDAQSGEALALAIHRELTVRGGQDLGRFRERAVNLGYKPTITELDAARAEVLRAGDPLRGDDWIFAWHVHEADGIPTEYFRAEMGRCGDKLVTRHQFDLECAFEGEKPAHTVILFAYGAL